MGVFSGCHFRLRTILSVAPFAVALRATEARAEPTFPGALRDAVPLACTPACTLCHLKPEGGADNAIKPFVVSLLKTNELKPKQPATMKAAVDKLSADHTDSNQDGTADIQQLKDGYDPNIGNSASLCGPSYGCGARFAAQRAPGVDAGLVFAAALAFGGIFVRQRRR